MNWNHIVLFNKQAAYIQRSICIVQIHDKQQNIDEFYELVNIV